MDAQIKTQLIALYNVRLKIPMESPQIRHDITLHYCKGWQSMPDLVRGIMSNLPENVVKQIGLINIGFDNAYVYAWRNNQLFMIIKFDNENIYNLDISVPREICDKTMFYYNRVNNDKYIPLNSMFALEDKEVYTWLQNLLTKPISHDIVKIIKI